MTELPVELAAAAETAERQANAAALKVLSEWGLEPQGVLAGAADAAVEAAGSILVDATFAAGVVAGRTQAAADIRAADTSGWPGMRGGDVDECQERAAKIAEGVR